MSSHNDDDKVITIELNIASDDVELDVVPQEIEIGLESGNGSDGIWCQTIDLG